MKIHKAKFDGGWAVCHQMLDCPWGEINAFTKRLWKYVTCKNCQKQRLKKRK